MLTLLLTACLEPSPLDTGGDLADTAGDTATPFATCAEAAAAGATGTVQLSFRMEADFIPAMDEAPIGTFHGGFFATADMTSTGPAPGAEQLVYVRVDGVDLSDAGGPTAILATTDPVPACDVTLLGYLDTDGNEIDAGDPVTLPDDAKLTVAQGQSVAHEAYFRLLNPGR